MLRILGRVGCSLLVLAAVSVVMPAGLATTLITSCGMTVRTDAVMPADLSCAGNGIIVGASGITIDLGGHKLSTTTTGTIVDGIKDTRGFDHVTVTNGEIDGFDTGINFFSNANRAASRVTLSHLTLQSNNVGIAMYGFHETISSSLIQFSGEEGISTEGGPFTIDGVQALDNDGVGMDICCLRATIVGSQASLNSQMGIFVFGSHAHISSTTASENGDNDFCRTSACQSGIVVQGSRASFVSDEADANGADHPAPDDHRGLGILVLGRGRRTAHGSMNTAVANDDPRQCFPTTLC